jgi:signal transduction histidine kinase/CheY-like chemotaxis protein
MRKFFRNLSIRLKLTAAIVTASFLVLILFSSAFVFVEIYSFRSEMVSDISAMADLLGTNAKSALMAGNTGEATTLLASLQAQPHIRSAYLFDHAGEPFAQYLDRSDVAFVQQSIVHDFIERDPAGRPAGQGRSVRFDRRHLSLFAPVFYQGETIGTIYLLSDNKALYNRIHGLLFGMLLAVGVLVPFSLVLARYLTKPLAEPLLNLVAKMTAVSEQSDFTVRAEKTSNDEVGALVDGFNEMLTQIEIRDGRLFDQRRFLEETVASRTNELQESVSKLEKAKQAAEAANQAKSNFLANMTHELRTPLIGVLGMNELLMRSALNDQQQSLVVTVQRSGEELLAMISDILDFSKIEAGHMHLENVDVDICRIVEEATALLAEKADRKGLRISCRVMPAALWKVRSDPVRIRQILLNLIGNAVKFTEAGEILIRLDMTTPGHGLGCFVLEVEDTGAGMSEEEQLKVFSAFVQADSTTTRQHGGTGLGLAIVQQLVALMGGKLSLESRKGKGSRFRVELMLPLLAQQLPRLPESMRGRRLLLYDDCAAGRAAIRTMLTALGLCVVETTSVEDAWYRLLADSRQDLPFDFALVSAEARLPDGDRLYAKMKKEPLLSRVRTIALGTRLERLANAYPDSLAVLEKPVFWSGLVETLVRSWKTLELVAPQVSEKRPVAAEPAAEMRPAEASRWRILLADDNLVTRELIRLSLQKYPLDIDQAASGVQVLEALQAKSYDLILMDCNMPELDGIQATRQLRGEGCEIPVVALTAHVDRRVFESCREAGMNDVLRKPFRQKDLHDLINKWLAPDSDDHAGARDTEPSIVRRTE